MKEKENYDAIQETTIKDLNVLREKHVEVKVRKFKESEALECEMQTWQWSALFLALSQNPVPNSPQRPWVHTLDEWQQIAAAMKDNCARGPLTLDGECPYIIQALKLFSRVTRGHSILLAHPRWRMKRKTILEIASNARESKMLKVCVHDVNQFEWLFFPT